MSESSDDQVAEAAEVVVAHLAEMRGGWVLSSPDGALLLRWLERGIPAATICRAVDLAAERRRARRVRAPLSLRSCRRDLEQLVHPTPRTSRGRRAPGTGRVPMGQGVSHLQGTCPRTGCLEDLARQALAEISGLVGQLAERREAALDIVRRFREDAWRAAGSEQAGLLAAAEAELAGVRSLLAAEEWLESVLDLAQDILRRRWPDLSAAAVLERVEGALPPVATLDPPHADFSASR